MKSIKERHRDKNNTQMASDIWDKADKNDKWKMSTRKPKEKILKGFATPSAEFFFLVFYMTKTLSGHMYSYGSFQLQYPLT